MRRTLSLLLLFLFLFAAQAAAQGIPITGKAIDAKTKAPVEFASAALLRTDSTAVLAATTDEMGRFTLQAKEPGQYLVRLTLVGFTPKYMAVTISAEADSVALGDVVMETTDNLLGAATVSVTASKVEQKEDTTLFNAAAYRVPEGSTLEALVKQLPGVEVGDDGTIKWNGKTVTEFLVNGKDFFKGDTQTAMKNLPTDLVSKIKAYDKKSDYTEQTGIDDGEETTVLDIATKRQLNESWVSNLDLAYGNHDRYSGRFFVTRFTDQTRVTAFGSANNTGDRGFGGPRGFGGGGGGLVATKNAGIDFSWENGRKKGEAGRLELSGSVMYRHSNSDALSTSATETFLTSGATSSFSNSWNHSVNKSTSVNARFRLQWNPDSMTTLTFRPTYSYSESKNNGSSRSATFNDDPFSVPGMVSPLDSILLADAAASQPALYALMVNTNRRLTLGDSQSHNLSGNLNIVRKLNADGRNVSLQLRGGWSKSESNSFSISHISYNTSTGKAPSFLNQYSTSPSKSYNYSARLGYVEPLGNRWFGELRYQYAYKYSDSDRSRFNLDSLAYEPYATLFPGYASYGDPDAYPVIGSLPTEDQVLNYVRDLNNSQYATYKYYEHTATVGVRYNTSEINFNAGLDLNPELTKMAYNRPGQHIDTLITRKVFMVSPQVRFRYKFSKTNQLDVRYRGYASQPSMTDLLAVVDDSNPLSISMGNPGLKPSWNNNLRIMYNGYNAERQQGMMASLTASQTINSISNRMVYDEVTGVQYRRPENINGNWNARASFMFNTALGAEKLFNISTYSNISYSNDVGYVSRMQTAAAPAAVPAFSATLVPLASEPTTPAADRSYDYYNKVFGSALSQKNTTRTWGFDEHARASYRNAWYDLGLIGRLNYQHARATVQENANLDTWNFSYGVDANLNFDFGLSFSTDIRMNSRRGYSDASMNTNELLWNVQIAQSFLPGRAATLSIQFYDILQKQSNISRTLSATQRSDTWTNAINSYFMVHFIYKLNVFSGGSNSKSDLNGDRPAPPDMRGPGGMPMRGGFGGPGGGPGGRM